MYLFSQENAILKLFFWKSSWNKSALFATFQIIFWRDSNFFDNFLSTTGLRVKLVSKELNHFEVIAGLFRQIWGHRSRFVLFCSFWRLFTVKMIKSVKVFPFSFWKITFFFTSENSNPQHKHAKWLPSDLNPWTLTLMYSLIFMILVILTVKSPNRL